MNCPDCGAALVPVSSHGVDFHRCPTCGGVWLDEGAVVALAAALPRVAEARPQSTRFEDRAPGQGAGRGVPFGGAHSRVKPEPAKSPLEIILKS